MANTSTVPAAKGGILALIRARPALATVQTSWSHPGDKVAKESVFMSAADFEDESISFLGSVKQNEEYVIPIWVDVLQEGDDAETGERRMWTLVGEVEQAINGNRDLGVGPPTILQSYVAGKEPDEYLSDQGRGFRCRIKVAVQGRY